jgi:hypothetical protein
MCLWLFCVFCVPDIMKLFNTAYLSYRHQSEHFESRNLDFIGLSRGRWWALVWARASSEELADPVDPIGIPRRGSCKTTLPWKCGATCGEKTRLRRCWEKSSCDVFSGTKDVDESVVLIWFNHPIWKTPKCAIASQRWSGQLAVNHQRPSTIKGKGLRMIY